MSSLIARFESSTKFKDSKLEGKMSINPGSNSKYNHLSKFEYRLEYNLAAVSLEQKELITLKWQKRNVILDKIYFNVADITRLYEVAGTTKKGDILDKHRSTIMKNLVLAETPWIERYFRDLVEYIDSKRRIPPIMEEKTAIDLFKVLIALVEERAEMVERVFSKKYLGNSKTFENEVRGKVISVIKNYYKELDTEGLSDEEILAEFGIDKSTSDLHIKGHLTISINGNIINLSAFPRGVGLDAKTLTEAEIVSTGFDRILSVENLANYKSECETTGASTLVVFSSGFYSPRKRKFLCKLRDFIMEQGQDVEFFHWGDLDFGGFNIFRHINSVVFPELKPYKMDTAIFLNNLLYAESFIKNEQVNLTKQLNDPRFTVFHDLIHEMLQQEKTLEQEALLIE